MHRWRAVAIAALVAGTLAAPAGGDSFTPVRMSIQVAAVARLRAPLSVTVRVSADPGALDDRSGLMRVQVKLAAECGGTYQYTKGTVLLDKALSPQPATQQAYSGVASGSGQPSAYGEETVCTWLEDQGDNRVFASDQSIQIDVSRACTLAAARYGSARRARRHTARRKLDADRRAARRACGPGVPL
jgi:hypothetical protein